MAAITVATKYEKKHPLCEGVKHTAEEGEAEQCRWGFFPGTGTFSHLLPIWLNGVKNQDQVLFMMGGYQFRRICKWTSVRSSSSVNTHCIMLIFRCKLIFQSPHMTKCINIEMDTDWEYQKLTIISTRTSKGGWHVPGSIHQHLVQYQIFESSQLHFYLNSWQLEI